MSQDLLSRLPIVAIIRGVTPARIDGVADALFGAGIRAIEVPLNSPDPFASIEKLARRFGDSCLTGAGTVTTVQDVDRAADAGGKLVVSPHADAAVIAHTVKRGLFAMPGVLTPSEAYAAIQAGARHLKLFPASSMGIAHFKAMRVILPPDVKMYAVGGVSPANMAEWRAAGIDGFGLGGDLFKPDFDDAQIAARARAAVAAFA